MKMAPISQWCHSDKKKKIYNASLTANPERNAVLYLESTFEMSLMDSYSEFLDGVDDSGIDRNVTRWWLAGVLKTVMVVPGLQSFIFSLLPVCYVNCACHVLQPPWCSVSPYTHNQESHRPWTEHLELWAKMNSSSIKTACVRYLFTVTQKEATI